MVTASAPDPAVASPPLPPLPVRDERYRPFPNEAGRNARQAALEVPLMVRALGLPRGARILEVGCGRGVALPVLARLCRPRRLAGLDIDLALLAEATERLRREAVAAQLVPGDVRAMPFEDASFDVVIDFGTCYHVTRPAAALREIARVLAPGGCLVHETPLSQLLAHPVRAFGRRLPWRAVPAFRVERRALLWTRRRAYGGSVARGL
jgi:ubiquinone/menaquinone biosynthesis C-methylase UbiE